MGGLIAAPLIAAGVNVAVAGAIGNFVVGTAFSALGQALTRPKTARAQDPGIATEFTGAGDTTPQSFILGRYATAGHKMAPDYCIGKPGRTPGKGPYMTMLRSLTDTPIDRLVGIWIDGRYLRYPEDFTIGSRFGLAVPAGTFEGLKNDRIHIEVHTGTQTAASEMLVREYGAHPTRPWRPTSVHPGAAYVALTVRRDPDLFPSKPDVRFVVDGLPLLDPRTGVVGATNNPMVHAWNLYQTIEVGPYRYGVGLPRSALPDALWLPAMNKCDLQVDAGGGTTEAQYRCGIEVTIAQPEGGGMEPLDAIDAALRTASANVADVGGMIHVRVGAPGLPVAAITDDDLLLVEGETHSPILPLAEIYNSVAATFPDPAKKWAAVEAPVVTDDAAVAELGETRQGDVDLSPVPYENQVKRLMSAWLADAKRGRVHGFALPALHAMRFVPLATLVWTSALHGYENKLFEVQERAVDPMSGQIAVTVREVDPADYDTSQVPVSQPGTPTQPIAIIPFDLGTLNLDPAIGRDASGVARRAGIEATWDTLDRDLGPVVVEYRLAGSTTVAVTDGTADGDTGRLVTFAGLLPGTDYEGRAKGIVEGSSVWTEWGPVTTPSVGLTAADFEETIRNRLLDSEEISALELLAFADAQEAQERADAVAADLTIVAQDIDTLSGNVTTVAGLLNAEIEEVRTIATGTDAILADYQQTVSASFGDLDARVTQNNLALVDVEGFAFASAGVTVETTGGGIAGFRATSFTNPDGTGGAVLDLLGSSVRAGTMSLDRLVAGQGRNLLQDAEFAQGTRFWSGTLTGTMGAQSFLRLNPPGSTLGALADPTLSLVQSGTAVDGGAKIVSRGIITGTKTLSTLDFIATPGQHYMASARAVAQSCTGSLFIEWLDGAGTVLGNTTPTVIPTTATPDASPRRWARYHSSGAAPANAVAGRIAVAKAPGTAANSAVTIFEPQTEETHAAATAPTPYSRGGTTLIDGGLIVTDNLVVTSAMIQSGAIVSAKIGDAAITSAKIANAAITNAKIGDLQVNTIKIARGSVTTAASADLKNGGSVSLACVADADLHITIIGFADLPYAWDTSATWGGIVKLNGSTIGSFVAARSYSNDGQQGGNGTTWARNLKIDTGNGGTWTVTLDLNSTPGGWGYNSGLIVQMLLAKR